MRFLFSLLMVCGVLQAAEQAERPNILWITAEDMSPVLGCYGDKFAITPNIDQLAKESVRYTKAFASAPVCSPSRSCLDHRVLSHLTLHAANAVGLCDSQKHAWVSGVATPAWILHDQ